MLSYHCLRVQGGIIVPLYVHNLPEIDKVKDDDLSLSFGHYGVCVRVKDLEIPIPDVLIDYFVENRMITIYSVEPEQYVSEAILAIEVPKESLMEVIGAYRYWQEMKKRAI